MSKISLAWFEVYDTIYFMKKWLFKTLDKWRANRRIRAEIKGKRKETQVLNRLLLEANYEDFNSSGYRKRGGHLVRGNTY